MKNIIKKAYEHNIANYLLYSEDSELDNDIAITSVEGRCKQAEERYEAYMQEILHDSEGTSPEFEGALNHLTIATDAYFEAGLISGFKLASTFWCQF